MDSLTVISIIFLCLFCLFLYYDNKRLNKIIDDLKYQNKDDYGNEYFKEDIVSIDDISKDIKEEEVIKNISIEEKDNMILNNIDKKNSVNKENNKEVLDVNSIDLNDKHITFNIDDFIKKEKIGSRKLDNSGMNREYLQEISRELESNVAPQTIKLTDYEQEQEDNAIISYKELLSANNKNQDNINDGTVEFIEELKKFRNNLR